MTLIKLEKYHKQVSHLIKAAHATAGKKRMYRITRYFHSHAAKRRAVEEANRHAPRHMRIRKCEIESFACKLDPFSKSGEPVIAKLVLDQNGNPKRIIMNFGLENRARQYLARHLLQSFADLQPQQYILKGGVNSALQRVYERVRDEVKNSLSIDRARTDRLAQRNSGQRRS